MMKTVKRRMKMMKSMVEEVRKKKNLSQMIQLNVSFFGKIYEKVC